MEQPKLWNYALGDSADVNELNDVAPEEGRVSVRNLFTEINSIPLQNGGKPPKRKDINALFKTIGDNIFYIQRGGQFNWTEGVTYPVNAVIQYNGVEYKALTENVDKVPDVSPDDWGLLVEITPEKLQQELAKLPKYSTATTDSEGIVALSNSTSNDATDKAATPLAVKTVNDSLNQTKEDVKDISSTLSTLNGNISKNTNDISDAKNSIASLETRTKGLETTVAGIESNKNDITDLKAKDTELENADEANALLIKQNTDKIIALETDIKSLQAASGDTTVINELNDKISSTETAVKANTSKLDTLRGVYGWDSTKTYKKGDLVSHEANIFVANSDVPAGKTPVIAKQADSDESGNKTENYWDYLVEGANLDTISESITSIDRRVTDVENKLGAEEINKLREDVNTLKDDINDVDETLDQIQGVYIFNADGEYDAGNIVEYKGKLYQALVNISKENTAVPETDRINWKALSSGSGNGLSDWDENTTYQTGDIVLCDNRIFRSNKKIVSIKPGSVEDVSSWTEISPQVDTSSLNAKDADLQKSIDDINNKIATLESGSTDPTTLATKTEVKAVSDRVTTLEGIDHNQYALKTDIPAEIDTSGFATKAELADYAKKADVPVIDTTKVASSDDLNAVSSRVTTLEQIDHDEFLTSDDLTDYAKKTDIPAATDISTLATKAELKTVSDKVTTLEGIDHSKYLTSNDLTGYAKKTDIPSATDTSTLATKAELKTVSDKVTALENNSSSIKSWSEKDTYKIDSLVIYDNKIYQATTENKNVTPGSGTQWKEISESEASTLLTKINAVSDRVTKLEGIDHSKYLTDSDLTGYAKKTDIPSTSNLATKTEVKAVSDRVTTLENVSSSSTGSSTGAVEYKAFRHYGMFNPDEVVEGDDPQNADWYVRFYADKDPFNSITKGADYSITVDMKADAKISGLMIDVYNDGEGIHNLNPEGQIVILTFDGKVPTWEDINRFCIGDFHQSGEYGSSAIPWSRVDNYGGPTKWRGIFTPKTSMKVTFKFF